MLYSMKRENRPKLYCKSNLYVGLVSIRRWSSIQQKTKIGHRSEVPLVKYLLYGSTRIAPTQAHLPLELHYSTRVRLYTTLISHISKQYGNSGTNINI